MLTGTTSSVLPTWAPNAAYTLLRIVAGALLLQHGLQKMLGLLLSPGREFTGAPTMFSQMWVAGILELVGSALVLVGLFTRPVAFLLSGLMAAAYFQAHAPRSFFPALNGGENAVLLSFVFLLVFAVGAGSFSVDHLIQSRRSKR